MLYKATIELYVDVDSVGEACDAVAEGMRDNLRHFAGPRSAWIDWHYSDAQSVPVPATEAEVAVLEYTE